MMDTPRFDEAVRVQWYSDGTITNLVVHRDIKAYVCHSPLDNAKIITCSICGSGARVYIK